MNVSVRLTVDRMIVLQSSVQISFTFLPCTRFGLQLHLISLSLSIFIQIGRFDFLFVTLEIDHIN